MAALERLADGLWRWKWWSADKQMFFNGYAARLAGGLVLVDPAYADGGVWSELESLGRPSKILLTNKDHERASDELRKRFGVKVAAHKDEAPLLNVPPEETFGDSDVLEGELKAVRLFRLKSPAECAFYWEPRRLLFVGDAVCGKPAGSLGLVQKHQGKPEVKQELRKLLVLDFDALLLGDGEPVLEGAKAALKKFVDPMPEA